MNKINYKLKKNIISRQSKNIKNKSFIKRIKDFWSFELVSLIVIPLIGAIIAFSSLRISSLQSKIMEFENSPYFELEEVYTNKGNGKLPDSQNIIITNIGGGCHNFEVNELIFLDAQIENYKGGFIKSSNFRKPVISYFSAHAYSKKMTGVLYEAVGFKNREKWNRIRNELDNYTLKEGGYIELNLEFVYRISYKNFMGNTLVKYYKVNFANVDELSDSKGKRLYDEYYMGLKNNNYISYDKFDTKDILNVN